jgi:hypothetical protein
MSSLQSAVVHFKIPIPNRTKCTSVQNCKDMQDSLFNDVALGIYRDSVIILLMLLSVAKVKTRKKNIYL